MTVEPHDDTVPRSVAPFAERVPGGEVLAVFDFDGTLTNGGSVWRFLSSLRGRRVVLGAGLALAPKMLRAALVGGRAADEAKQALFLRTLAGLEATAVAGRAHDFGLAHFARRQRLKVRARLDWHRRQGHCIVIVSASPEWYVGAVGEELDVDGVVATRLQVDDRGRLTGRLDGANCRGEEKLRRLEEWLETSRHPGPAGAGAHVAAHVAASVVRPGDRGTPDDGQRPFLWAYGNSAGDRALLEAADIGVDAGRLGRLGKLRRFRRLGDVLTAW